MNQVKKFKEILNNNMKHNRVMNPKWPLATCIFLKSIDLKVQDVIACATNY